MHESRELYKEIARKGVITDAKAESKAIDHGDTRPYPPCPHSTILFREKPTLSMPLIL